MKIIDHIVMKVLGRIDIHGFKIAKLEDKKKEEKKEPLLKNVINNPEEFKLEAYVENDEIIVKIKRRES